MDADSYILSGNIFSGTVVSSRSLCSVLSGVKSDTAEGPQRLDWTTSATAPQIFKRMKDVALLFLVSTSTSGEPAIEKIDLCDMELSINFHDKPLFWLGQVNDDQSVDRLKEVYAAASTATMKKILIEAVGIHQRSVDAYPFLTSLLNSSEPDDIRAKATFWIGEQNNPEELKLLMEVAQKDHSLKVREEAVFAISRLCTDESTDALIALARKADDTRVRAKATFWLGQQASKKTVATLEEIVADDEETDVQRQALFGLSRSKDRHSIEWLIRIATTHPNPRIRKQAIQLLGHSDDPEALDALIAIVRK